MWFSHIFIHSTILILSATLPGAGDSGMGQISVSCSNIAFILVGKRSLSTSKQTRESKIEIHAMKKISKTVVTASKMAHSGPSTWYSYRCVVPSRMYEANPADRYNVEEAMVCYFQFRFEETLELLFWSSAHALAYSGEEANSHIPKTLGNLRGAPHGHWVSTVEHWDPLQTGDLS